MKYCVGLLLVTIILFSCQKEVIVSLRENENPADSTAALLVKQVIKLNGSADSTSISYKYNPQKKLIEYDYSDISFTDNENFKIFRNSSGIIIRILFSSPNIFGGVDSIVYHVFYDATKGHYVNTVAQWEFISGFPMKDSIVYSYDSQNRIVLEQLYRSDPGNGIPDNYYFQKTEYTYDVKSNLTGFKFYGDVSGTLELSETCVFEYDDKINPLQLKNEAFLLGYYPELVSPNNIKKATFNYPAAPADNNIIEVAYLYRGDDRPVSYTITYGPSGEAYQAAYYYQ